MAIEKVHEPELNWLIALLVYLSYGVLIAFGHIRDFIGETLSNIF